jgi:N6-adenosine-specific RNA methylase IME4
VTEIEPRSSGGAAAVTEDQVLALVEGGWADLERAVAAGDPAMIAEIQRRADAIRYLSKKAKLAIGAVNAAARLKTDAEWNAGRMLREAGLHGGDRRSEDFSSGQHVNLKDMEIETHQSHRWQDMSRVDRAEIDAYYKGQEEKRAEIASSAIAHMGARARRLEKIVEKQQEYEVLPPDDRPVPVIYADPPWRYEHAISDSRKIENQYPTMTVEQIAAEDPAPEEDAVLLMWVTSPKLREGLQVMEAWGFTYRTSMVWVKPQIGMGYYVRGQHEFLLIGALGSLPTPLPENRPSSVIDGRRTAHSAKPELRPVIDAMYPDLWKREMFSREPAGGLWLTHGYERNPV